MAKTPEPVVIEIPQPAPPVDERVEEIERLEALVADLRAEIETNNKENRTWTENQLKDATTRLENLEANSKTGLENLSGQLSELRELLTQRLQPIQQEPELEMEDPPLETPPIKPPSEGAEDPPEPGPQSPPKPRKRVV